MFQLKNKICGLKTSVYFILVYFQPKMINTLKIEKKNKNNTIFPTIEVKSKILDYLYRLFAGPNDAVHIDKWVFRCRFIDTSLLRIKKQSLNLNF